MITLWARLTYVVDKISNVRWVRSLQTDFEALDDLLDAVALARADPSGLPISVYNAKQETVRNVLIHPDDHWGGQGW